MLTHARFAVHVDKLVPASASCELWHRWSLSAAISGLAVALSSTVLLGVQPSFTGLGDLPGGNFMSLARAVSPDGTVVVGLSTPADSRNTPFRWEAGVVQGLGVTSGVNGSALGVSDQGRVVVGSIASGGGHAFRWENGFMAGLEELTDAYSSGAYGVSADGSVIVGNIQSVSGYHAVCWQAGVIAALAEPAGGSVGSSALAVSSDGKVAVGWVMPDANTYEAFRWVGGAATGLGDLEGGVFSSQAYGVSADGSVAVGDGVSASGNEAFRWENGTMVGLGNLPGGKFFSRAMGVSADGRVAVGFGYDGTGQQAVVWDSIHGIRVFQGILTGECGLDLAGWQLNSIAAVTPDGKTFVGSGIDPAGNSEAWIAVIPEPASPVLWLVGVAVFCRRRSKSR